jgi:hypothetical protein
MKKKIKAVMLPTGDNSSNLLKCIKSFDINYEDPEQRDFDNEGNISLGVGIYADTEFYQHQHLYVTVSQYIIRGEQVYYIDKFTNKLISSGGAEYGSKQDVVIATTDPKLSILTPTYFDKAKTRRSSVLNQNPIPQLQQSFLKEYVANPDGEWEVEYETKTLMKPADVYVEEVKTKLKLNQDNTVNITSVEEKMYSLSDLERLGDYAYMNAKSTWDWKKFIKENL